MNLPLKIFYTLKEASKILNERLHCTEITEDYFFHLGIKGEIRLGIFANPSFSEGESGVLYSDWFEFSESEEINYLKAINRVVQNLNEVGAILILNSGSVKDIYFNSSVELNKAYFDNVYSIDTLEFAVNGDLEENFSCCQFFDKLAVLDFFNPVFYSEKHNAIQDAGIREKYLSFPEHEEDDDWKVAFWFNSDFDLNKQDMREFQSESEICVDNCIILGEDLQLLLDGKCREPIVKHPRKHSVKANYSEPDLKLHPKRANSINQIIYALTKMADLDLSQHQSAYTQLEAFCNSKGIEIPKKDTSGNLFKEVYRAFNAENSK